MKLWTSKKTIGAYRRVVMFGFALATLSCVALATAVPQFGDYPRVVSTEKVKTVDLKSHPKAQWFEDQLKEAVGKSPNFAGHYVVVTRGCGTSCQAVAMIDVTSGKVIVASFSTGLGSDFRADSGLFIDSPPKAIREYYGGDPNNVRDILFFSNYYVWDEKKHEFQLVYKEEQKK